MKITDLKSNNIVYLITVTTIKVM